MLDPGSFQSLPKLNTLERHAVVFDMSRAHDQGFSALVFCLEIVWDFQNVENACVIGHPFQLHNKEGRYIWLNEELRNKAIEVGSIISCRKPTEKWYYSGNTEKKLVSLNYIISLTYSLLERIWAKDQKSFSPQPKVVFSPQVKFVFELTSFYVSSLKLKVRSLQSAEIVRDTLARTFCNVVDDGKA